MEFLKTRKGRLYIFYAALFLGLMTMCFAQGFMYYSFADDYNQYGVYLRRIMEGGAWDNVIMWYKRFSDRPLSFFTDVYLISPFFDNLSVVLIFTIVMHFFTGLMLKDIFKKSGINFSLIALVIFLLYPLLYESVYWISASSRIVLGMFLSVSSVWFFLKLLNKQGRFIVNVILFIILNVLSVGYYEQVIIFMICFYSVILYLNKEKLKSFTPKILCLVPYISVGIIFIYYFIFSFGDAGDGRGTLLNEGFFTHAAETSKKIAGLFTKTNINVFSGGIKYAFSDLKLLIPLLISAAAIIFSGFFVFLGKNADNNDGNVMKSSKSSVSGIKIFIISVILIIAPYSIFFILRNSYIAVRSAYTSFPGIALIVEFMFDLLLSKKKPITPLIACFLAALFIIPNGGIIAGYKTCYERSEEIAKNFLIAFSKGGYTKANGDDKIAILNTFPMYEDLALPLETVLEGSWRIQGILNSKRGDNAPRFTNISVIPESSSSKENFDIMFFYDEGNFYEISSSER